MQLDFFPTTATYYTISFQHTTHSKQLQKLFLWYKLLFQWFDAKVGMSTSQKKGHWLELLTLYNINTITVMDPTKHILHCSINVYVSTNIQQWCITSHPWKMPTIKWITTMGKKPAYRRLGHARIDFSESGCPWKCIHKSVWRCFVYTCSSHRQNKKVTVPLFQYLVIFHHNCAYTEIFEKT